MKTHGNAKTVFAILMIVVFLAWCFYKAPIASYQTKLMQMYADSFNWMSQQITSERVANEQAISEKLGMTSETVIEAEDECHGNLPKHGRVYSYTQPSQNLKQSSKLWVNNMHVYPVWVTLFDVDTLDSITSFYIQPGKHSKLQLPVGEYEVEVQSGTVWCNFSSGFEDASLLDADTVLSITPNEVAHIRLSSFGSMPSDMMFSAGKPVATYSRLGQKVRGAGSLKLQKVVGGHFAVQGSINQQPAFFMVDTGAFVVAVPHAFAKHAGIKGCKEMKITTASGVVDSCLGMAKELQIGQFVFNDVEVAYAKSMPADTFLLGMNVLSQFKMVQQSQQMTLSR